MPIESKAVYLKQPPLGTPVTSDFEIKSEQLDDPAQGQVLVENIYMSVDPYMRGRMRFMKSGDRLFGGAVGRIIASRNAAFSEGSLVLNQYSWREHFLSDGSGLQLIEPDLAPLSTYLGIMGMPGLTAWGGLLITGEYKPGETLFVSAASGAVGSVVGQIARIKGGIAIGSAGSDEKVSQLVNEFGFSHAFNYKTQDPLTELRQAAPEGIDVYFENVGGKQLEAALTHMRAFGRIPICGMIAHYNDHDSATPGPRNLSETIYKFITLRGFVVSAFEEHKRQFQEEMADWIRSGEMKYQETIFEGIDQAPEAFIGLFNGTNQGKMLVKLANE
jgi:NADPH-dependent curcumin reductase CurA